MDVQPASTVGVVAPVDAGQAQTAVVASADSSPTAVAHSQGETDANQSQATLAPAVAKLFGAANAAPAQLNVSYRVEGGDVVTVFTDPRTHKEVAQFPPELLLGLAQFFDQQSGITFDKSA